MKKFYISPSILIQESSTKSSTCIYGFIKNSEISRSFQSLSLMLNSHKSYLEVYQTSKMGRFAKKICKTLLDVW